MHFNRFHTATYKYDELNKTFATHQTPNSKGLAPFELVESCRQRATNDLSGESHGNDANHISPSKAVVEQAEVGAQSRKSKV